MTRSSAVLALVILGILLYWVSDEDRLKQASVVFDSLFSDRPRLSHDRFRKEALKEINHVRGQLALSPLSIDPELEEALALIVDSQPDPSAVSLDTLFNLLRDRFPGAQFLSATLLVDSEESGLLEGLRNWNDISKEDYESIATRVFQSDLQHGCLAVLTRRLPSFNLQAANRDGGRFFNRCPRCRKSHAIELDHRSQTLILSCPDCDRPYDVLAADVDGQFRRAPDFLRGNFRLAAVPARTPERRLREIWAEVLNHCEYEYDTKTLKRGEAWKTPVQTWGDGAGDCEDTAILLADLLIAAGIDARVAIGWNIHIGQHAWAVARIGHTQYLLETTGQPARKDGLPELVNVSRGAAEYLPEQLFDRENLYFREGAATEPQACFDYWTETEWPAIKVNHFAGAE